MSDHPTHPPHPHDKIAMRDMFGTRLVRPITHRKAADLDMRTKLSDFLATTGCQCADTPKLWIHNSLIDGDQEGASSLFDFNHMEADFKSTFLTFLFRLANGLPLRGRNKPSSFILPDGSQSNPKLAGYWHCHIGPYGVREPLGAVEVSDLGQALSPGLTSGPIIHYQPDSTTGEFTIVGAASKHDKFAATQFLADEDANWKIIRRLHL